MYIVSVFFYNAVIFIGVSGAFGVFTPEVLQGMAALNSRPIVFALSNPADTCECTAEEAYINTNVSSHWDVFIGGGGGVILQHFKISKKRTFKKKFADIYFELGLDDS